MSLQGSSAAQGPEIQGLRRFSRAAMRGNVRHGLVKHFKVKASSKLPSYGIFWEMTRWPGACK